jgi:hypothetical protein
MDIILNIDDGNTRLVIEESEIAPKLANIVCEEYNPQTKTWTRLDNLPALDKKEAKKLAYLLVRWYDLKEKIDSYE